MDESLVQYMERVAKEDRKRQAIVNWHIKAHLEGGVELPYTVDTLYCNLNQYSSEAPYERDAQKSLDALAKVAQYAVKAGKSVEKKYDSTDFELRVTILEPQDDYDISLVVNYYANRETVCTKKVVGTKVVPAQTIPERVEEIVEWECDPISLLAHESV